jgi:hypothetical protein
MPADRFQEGRSWPGDGEAGVVAEGGGKVGGFGDGVGLVSGGNGEFEQI